MIKLWNQTMPHRCVEDAFEPYLTPYDCDAAKTAIVVCPGGAYCGRADYEGNDVGAWLNTIGITAFVLEYRVAPSKAPAQPSDAQRAMRLARKLCMERGIERLGIMGFSAGGHLAATLSVHYDEAFYPPQDALDNLSACPDFTVLCYSVIDMGEYRKQGETLEVYLKKNADHHPHGLKDPRIIADFLEKHSARQSDVLGRWH